MKIKCPNCSREVELEQLNKDYETGNIYCQECEDDYVDEQVRKNENTSGV